MRLGRRLLLALHEHDVDAPDGRRFEFDLAAQQGRRLEVEPQVACVDAHGRMFDDDAVEFERPGQHAAGASDLDADAWNPVQLRHQELQPPLGMQYLVPECDRQAGQDQQQGNRHPAASSHHIT